MRFCWNGTRITILMTGTSLNLSVLLSCYISGILSANLNICISPSRLRVNCFAPPFPSPWFCHFSWHVADPVPLWDCRRTLWWQSYCIAWYQEHWFFQIALDILQLISISFPSFFLSPVSIVQNVHRIFRFHCWMGVYSNTADTWGFDAIRSLCIRKLGDMALDPVEKMELCHRFEIGALGAYETLCTRSTLLSLSDVTRIGMENLVLITNAHKKQLKKRVDEIRLDSQMHGVPCSACGRTLEHVQNKCIQNMFLMWQMPGMKH